MREDPVEAAHESELRYRHNRVTRVTHWGSASRVDDSVYERVANLQRPPASVLGQHLGTGKERSFHRRNQRGRRRPRLCRIFMDGKSTRPVFSASNREPSGHRRAPSELADHSSLLFLPRVRRWSFLFRLAVRASTACSMFFTTLPSATCANSFTFGDAKKVPAMVAYYLHLRKHSPQEGRI